MLDKCEKKKDYQRNVPMLLLSIKICIFAYMIKWNMIVNKFEIRYIIYIYVIISTIYWPDKDTVIL